MEKVWEKQLKELRLWVILIFSAVILIFSGNVANAKQRLTPQEKLHQEFVNNTKGKTIAFVPIGLGIPLCDTWAYQMAIECKKMGMKLLLRDPNWSVSSMTQELNSLINLHPDVIVFHNPNAQVLANVIKKAERKGIYCVQINMPSNYISDALVGVDWVELGHSQAEDIVKEATRDGRSGEIAILQGEMTSNLCIEQTKAEMEVFKKHPEVKVVANQSASWDANKAHNITSVILQQHPHLSVLTGYWQGQDFGAAQAIKEAGLTGKVLLYSTGELTCAVRDAIKDGRFYKYYDYHPLLQGHDIMNAIRILFELKKKPGAVHLTLYSHYDIVTKKNIDRFSCWTAPTSLVKKLVAGF